METEKPRWLSTSEVARMLGVSVDRVRQLERIGVLPTTTKIGRGQRVFDSRDVARLVVERRRK
jgi:DNA-binding transcriptional MerR regulator